MLVVGIATIAVVISISILFAVTVAVGLITVLFGLVVLLVIVTTITTVLVVTVAVFITIPVPFGAKSIVAIGTRIFCEPNAIFVIGRLGKSILELLLSPEPRMLEFLCSIRLLLN